VVFFIRELRGSKGRRAERMRGKRARMPPLAEGEHYDPFLTAHGAKRRMASASADPGLKRANTKFASVGRSPQRPQCGALNIWRLSRPASALCEYLRKKR
jgi:hypothetical protein